MSHLTGQQNTDRQREAGLIPIEARGNVLPTIACIATYQAVGKAQRFARTATATLRLRWVRCSEVI